SSSPASDVAIDADDGGSARAEPQLGALEHAVEHVTLALHAEIYELSAFAGDDEHWRHVGGGDIGGKLDPGAAAIVEHTCWRPDRRSPAHGADAVAEIKPVDARNASALRLPTGIGPGHLGRIRVARLRDRFDQIGAPIGDEHDIGAQTRCLRLHQHDGASAKV